MLATRGGGVVLDEHLDDVPPAAVGQCAALLALPVYAEFVAAGAAVLGAGVGLVAGRRWARTPAIVTQLLLLPVVYSLIGPSRQLALGIAAGVYVVATFLLLISDRSRAWSLDLDAPR